jgi:hypothetical protein
MKHLFEATAVEELKGRIGRLGPASERHWGKMTAAQALAHCSIGMETATGDRKLPRMFLGRILGPMVKGKMLGSEPLSKNSPTAKDLIVQDDRNLSSEQARLSALIDKFAQAGPQGCTTHPHTFFGPLTPAEWATLMYKHLDHHLRQFGV